MKALVYARYGGPEVLQIAEYPIPQPGPLDVVVRVRAATVGIGDCKTRAGLLQHFHALKLPTIPGRYGVGEIASVGAEVTAVGPGDGVVFATLHTESGSNAEYVRVSAEKTAPKPLILSDVETASLLPGATCAYICLVETAAAATGQNILIHGAAGSVGSACVELARHLGCHITATCRDFDRDYVRSLGTDDVVAFDREDFAALVRDQDVVVDLLGGDAHRRSYGVLRRGGRLVYLHADPFENRGADYGVQVLNAVIDNRGSVLDKVCRLAEQGVFVPMLGRSLPLAEGAMAHRLVETNSVKRGRVVLQILECMETPR
jgi:NADPH:quinone reductase-like Zn-dependent oxidoreductase